MVGLFFEKGEGRRKKKEERRKKKGGRSGCIIQKQCGKDVFKGSYNSEFCNMLTLSHKKLEVYQQALLFTKLVYKITEGFPKAEQFGLSSQLRRATVSVLSNIAEGVSRSSDKEKIRFLEVY